MSKFSMWKKTTSEKGKVGSNKNLGLEGSLNGLRKGFRKKNRPKKPKNNKKQREIAACEQKTTSEKANVCSNTVFSLYFNFRGNIFHRELFRSTSIPFSAWQKSLLQFDFKNHKNIWKTKPEEFRKRIKVENWPCSQTWCTSYLITRNNLKQKQENLHEKPNWQTQKSIW